MITVKCPREAKVTLMHGDCLQLLKTLPDNSVDSIVTDPPYGLSFMEGSGVDWDSPWKKGDALVYDNPDDAGGEPDGYGGNAFSRGKVRIGASKGFQEWVTAWAAECLRVLKPGGHMLAAGGTRMYHRLASGIEDAGFDVRDCITWHYGSGMVKALDISKQIAKLGFSAEAKQWEGYKSHVKPATEIFCLARKPIEADTIAGNVLMHGTGALNIDGCRIPTDEKREGNDSNGKPLSVTCYGNGLNNFSYGSHDAGRFPSNVMFDEFSAELLDRQTGAENSRFFYVAKASAEERAAGVPEGVKAEIEIELTVDSKTIEAEETEWERQVRKVRLQVDTAQLQPKVTDVSTQEDETAWNTLLFGSGFTAILPKECKYTTGTAISSTTELKTLNYLTRLLISDGIQVVNCEKESGGSLAVNAESSKSSLSFINANPVSLPGVGIVASGTRWRISESVKRLSHPTIKPLSLMRQLVRLVTPPGGTVLEPFMGSGTTLCACIAEGFDGIGMEQDFGYLTLAQHRVENAKKERLEGLYNEVSTEDGKLPDWAEKHNTAPRRQRQGKKLPPAVTIELDFG